MSAAASRQAPLVSDVAKAAIGVGGLAMCITLLFLSMRAVMDIGGACAEGGPYVSRQSCPDGATATLFIGMFGLFLFGAIAMIWGPRVGGIWTAAPLLGWCGLFLSLGWNFLDYGVLNPPEGQGIVWGWLIPGVMFMIMGGAPLVFGLSAFGGAVVGSRKPGPPSAPAATVPLGPTPGPDGDPRRAYRTAMDAAAADPEIARREAALRDLATDMGSVVNEAVADRLAEAPADPLARAAGSVEPGFVEGDQALLDRLERLADLRERGLLAPDEYETAKDAIMRELEERTE